MMYDHDFSAWGWVRMSLGALVFWVLLISTVVLVVRALTRQPADSARSTATTGSAEEVLAERFARGDIDAAEYRERLQILRAAGPKPAPDPASMAEGAPG